MVWPFRRRARGGQDGGQDVMSKKLINNPEHVVTEMLEGLVMGVPHLSMLEGAPDIHVVVNRDHDHNNVAVISGGGSGHEPSHAGFCGHGALAAAVCGNVFASPSVEAVLAAIRAVTGPAGCLLVVKNYTGDRLNFGIAAEQAKSEGLAVRMVIIADDAALQATGIAGRRGLAGTLFVHKVAGAAAAGGSSLEEVAELAELVSGCIATMGVALTACSLPGGPVPVRLGSQKMELGLGIHGEPGLVQENVQPVDAVVEKQLAKVMEMSCAEPGSTVAVMVNGMGGTPLMELYVLARSAVLRLRERYRVRVDRLYVGNFMTALDMAGASLTVLALPQPELILALLDQPTEAPAWPRGLCCCAVEKPALPQPQAQRQPESGRGDGGAAAEDGTLAGSLRACIAAAARALASREKQLNDWDRQVGDGDCGSTVRQASAAVLKDLEADFPLTSAAAAAGRLALLSRRAMGGTSGAMYSLFFSAAQTSLVQAGPSTDAATLAEAMQEGARAIGEYGGAAKGDCTMLDALLPAAAALHAAVAEGAAAGAAAAAAAAAAEAGADATRGMAARAGRASYVAEEVTRTVPDPGAKAVAFWLRAVADALPTA